VENKTHQPEVAWLCALHGLIDRMLGGIILVHKHYNFAADMILPGHALHEFPRSTRH
jgi:hypothetical protein